MVINYSASFKMCALQNLAKILLYIVILLFILSGAMSLALGIWLRIDSASVFNFYQVIKTGKQSNTTTPRNESRQDEEKLVMIANWFIVVGIFMLIMGICFLCIARKIIELIQTTKVAVALALIFSMLSNIFFILVIILLIYYLNGLSLLGLFKIV